MPYQEYKTQKKYVWQTASDLIPKTGYYSKSITEGTVIEVNTLKGIIDITDIDSGYEPKPAFSTSVTIYINNPSLDLKESNRDNVYVQLTPYYKPSALDKAIPYVISNGFVVPNGLGVQIFNASPDTAGANQWEGAFYIYYEIHTIK